jgi:hypothetical protein
VIIESSIYVDPVLYNRETRIKEKTHDFLRGELLKQSPYINWETEIIETILHKASRKCEDRLQIIMKASDI